MLQYMRITKTSLNSWNEFESTNKLLPVKVIVLFEWFQIQVV